MLAWLPIGLKILGMLPGIITAVETLVKDKKGPDKQDAAIALLGNLLTDAEQLYGKPVLDVPEVESAVRSAIDAVVHVQNVLAKYKAQQSSPANA